MTRLGDCVLGATAAETLGLRPGETLMSDPENVLDLAGSYPINMHVTGILAANGTADDGAVFVDIKTVWLIMGIMHGHQDAATADPSLLLQRDANNVTASAALLPYQEVTPENIGSFHVHGDPATFPVGAVVVVPHDEKSAAILRGRYQDPKATVQLLAPQQVVAETLDLVFRVKRFFDAQSLLVGVATGLLLALVVLLSLRLRRGEMETMFKIGCARWMVFWLQATEILIVLAAGAAIASVACLDDGPLVGPVGTAGRRRGRRARRVRRRPAPANASRSSTIRWSILRGASPAIVLRSSSPCRARRTPPSGNRRKATSGNTSRPTSFCSTAPNMQSGCRPPCCRLREQVVTSRSFADRYVKNGEVVTHSHGPQGMHSHGLIDFNTWMDPQQAALQARGDSRRTRPSRARRGQGFRCQSGGPEKRPGGS